MSDREQAAAASAHIRAGVAFGRYIAARAASIPAQYRCQCAQQADLLPFL